MKRAVNLLFGTFGLFILIFLYVFADSGNYKSFSVLILALVINGYVLYNINKEEIKTWMKKH